MNRPFALYPDSFDGATLGYWRFGETGGNLSDVVAGKVFTNVGCDIEQDGYRWVRADSDQLTATYNGEPAHQMLTLECWMRDFEWLPDQWNYGELLNWWQDGNNMLYVMAVVHADPSFSRFWARYRVGGVWKGDFSWISAEADALLRAPEPVHVALVLDSTAPRLSLYVNGIKRAEDSVNPVQAPAGNYQLAVGSYPTVWAGHDYGGIIDEVRVSATARYGADFSPVRFGEGRRALARGPGMRAGLCAGVVG
jgi:hypothetical protein